MPGASVPTLARVRLFLCVRPPPEAVASLLTALPAGRWPSERWHVTLAFLGEVDASGPVQTALQQVVSPPLALALEGSGRFGRTTWVGVGGDTAGLHRLAGQVRRACEAAGLELERRPYRPHLTLGRPHPPAALAAYAGPSWTATEVELVRSHLGREVRHEVVSRHPLLG